MSPTRCCIACRKRNEKKNLMRIVADQEGNAIYDKVQKENSRGIYLCRDLKCIEMMKKYILKNKFKVKISVKQESFLQLMSKMESELGE